MKAFVISLESDKSRRSHIRGQLEKLGMEYEFFNAVRGSERIQDRRWYDPDEALKC
jgi:GR25 family glycosyltransferase involved in LPS biosynthesis